MSRKFTVIYPTNYLENSPDIPDKISRKFTVIYPKKSRKFTVIGLTKI